MSTQATRWRRFWEAAPRQLRFTRAGKVLIGLALATGFAAINTGNNLLFLAWGLVLSAIALSGVLSELVLRDLELSLMLPQAARAGEAVSGTLTLANRARYLPAYALELSAEFEGPRGLERGAGPFQLHYAARRQSELLLRFAPTARGKHVVRALVVRTRYPFGFFEKSRRFALPMRDEIWVQPAALPVDELVAKLRAAAGEASAPRPGAGDEYFGLRPLRTGDDPRRIYLRRSLKTRRLVVRETEATAGRVVVLELCINAAAGEANERALAALGSLAEQLLARDFAVGIAAPGLSLAPGLGAGQREAALNALARVDLRHPPAPRRARLAALRVALVGAAAEPPPGVGLILRVPS